MDIVIVIDGLKEIGSLPDTDIDTIHLITVKSGQVPVEILELCNKCKFKIHYIEKPYDITELAFMIGGIVAQTSKDVVYIGNDESLVKLTKHTIIDEKGQEHHLVASITSKKVPKQRKSKLLPNKINPPKEVSVPENNISPNFKKDIKTERKSSQTTSHSKRSTAKVFNGTYKQLMENLDIPEKYSIAIMAAIEESLDAISFPLMLQMKSVVLPGCKDMNVEDIINKVSPYFTSIKKEIIK